jgi:hypothetical protein
MAAQDWHVLRKVALHTLNNGVAILSFVLLAYLTKSGIQDQTLSLILERIEGVVLIVLVLIFGCQLVYDVLPEKIRGLFAAKFVFA